MNILFVNLLNNYSGSPRVLSNIVKTLSLYKKYDISLLTSKTDGCLSNIPRIIYYSNYYKWSNNKIIKSVRFFFAQIYIFLFIILRARKINVIYINTIVPFMASIAGSLIRKKIIYHVHEVFRNPNILQKIMWYIMEMNATKIIVVSKYVNQYLKRKDAVIIYNMVSKDFEKESKRMIQGIDIAKYKYEKKNILMISSLKKYKGIDIFLSLARKCPGYSFVLVLSSSCKDIEKYFSYVQLPGNLLLLEQRDNLLSFYFDASIVINLSMPDLWIETFGMTLLEGLQFGTPCIAPDFGGPKEIIIDGINGFLINPYNEDSIVDAINTILNSEGEYTKYVKNALSSKELFDFNSLIKQLYYEINSIL